MDRAPPDPRRVLSGFQRLRALTLTAALGLATSCEPGSGGCEEPPVATDAAAGRVHIQETAPPCTFSNQGVHGSKGKLIATMICPGTSKPFLVAVRIEGKLVALKEVTGAAYSSEIQVDAGDWDTPDTLWHRVEIVVDPLNLFVETDETNNRSVDSVRLVPPDISLNDYLTRVIDDSGNTLTSASVGQPLRVVAFASVGGVYQSATLSAKSTEFDFSTTISTGTCALLAGGPPFAAWPWTPTRPGMFTIDYRVSLPNGEPDPNAANNAISRPFTVAAASPIAARRPAPQVRQRDRVP